MGCHRRCIAATLHSSIHPENKILGLQVADIEKAEREKMREKVNNIIGHGINCFINRQARHLFNAGDKEPACSRPTCSCMR